MSRNKCLNTAAVKECEECAEGDCFLHGKRMGKLIIDLLVAVCRMNDSFAIQQDCFEDCLCMICCRVKN